MEVAASENGSTSTVQNSRGQRSGVEGTDVPLVMMSAYEYTKHQPTSLPQLPSHKLRYSVWHDLRSTYVTGDQLKAPRVRNGPKAKEKTFHSLRDEDGQLIHHSLVGKEKQQHQLQTENWENALIGNLPYQDLSHSYQRENFMRILKRMIRVRVLNLSHNSLTDLSSCSFPNCQELNLSNNYFSSFKDLPKLQNIRYLNLSFNDICSVNGLSRLAKTPLVTLELYGNGITFRVNYRQSVFQALPNLKILDSVPKLKTDEVFDNATQDYGKTCVIS